MTEAVGSDLPLPAAPGAMAARDRDAVAILGLVAVVVAVFSEALFGQKEFFQRDILTYWYPQVETLRNVIARRAWPVWDPYEAFGQPLLADPGSQVFYPFTWLTFLLNPGSCYKLYVLLHCLGTALGLYLLLRMWALDRAAAFTGAAVWAASGPLLSTVSLFHHFAGVAWTPWVLLALERLLRRPTLRGAVALGAVCAGQLFAGSGDFCLVTAVLAAIRCLSGPFASHRTAALARLVPAAIVAALVLGAVQWLPTVSILRLGDRLNLAPQANLYWSVHPAALVDTFVPRLTAELPMSDWTRSTLYESREPFLNSLYLGSASLLVASFGLLRGPRRIAAAAGGAASFFLLLALGRYAFVLPWLTQLPPFSLFRYPVKYMLPVAFCAAILVAAGMQGWLRIWNQRDHRWARALAAGGALMAMTWMAGAEWLRRDSELFEPLLLLRPDWAAGEYAGVIAASVFRLRRTAVVASAVAALFLYRSLRPESLRWSAAALVAVVASDLVLAGRGVNPLAPPELLRHRPALLDEIASDAGRSRVFVSVPFFAHLNRRLRWPMGWDAEAGFALGVQDLLVPPSGARFGLAGSYDPNQTGLSVAELGSMSSLAHQALPTPLGLKLLQMANVGYVVTLEKAHGRNLEAVKTLPSAFGDPIRLFRVPDPVPRIHVVAEAGVAAQDRALRMLVDPAFDPHLQVVLAPGAEPLAPAGPLRSSVVVLEERPDRLRVEATTMSPGVLIVVGAWDPGWLATLDGAPTPVHRANVLFRAVKIPAGRHVVEMSYRPPAIRVGVLITGAGIFGATLLVSLRARHVERRAA